MRAPDLISSTSTSTSTVLILGGTTEGRLLAEGLSGCRVIYSVAGRTAAPRLPEGVETRTGGFGGPEGLAAFLTAENVSALVDATHPFAARISANARAAAGATGTPRLLFDRPPWDAAPGDKWIPTPTVGTAASQLKALGVRAFLAVGLQELAAFRNVESFCLVRLLEDQPVPLRDATVVTGRGPFAIGNEIALLKDHGIELVVTKNAGGDASRAKLDAARVLNVPVMLIDRPKPEPGPRVTDLAWAGRWVVERLS